MNLLEFKAEKLSEEKDLKSKEKLLNNKLKAVEEHQARITIGRKKNLIETSMRTWSIEMLKPARLILSSTLRNFLKLKSMKTLLH